MYWAMVWRILVAFGRKRPGIIQYRCAIIDGLGDGWDPKWRDVLAPSGVHDYSALAGLAVGPACRSLSRITRRSRASPSGPTCRSLYCRKRRTRPVLGFGASFP